MEKAEQFIYLFGLKIYEPTTILTNVVIAILALIFFFRLSRYKSFRNISSWRFFFLFLAASSLFGAVAHAVHYQSGEGFFKAVWFLMNFMTLLSSYMALRATVASITSNENTYYKVNTGMIAWVVVLVVITIAFNNFKITELNIAAIVLFIFITHILLSIKDARYGKAYKLIVAGFGVSISSVIIHVTKFSLHEHFNFKDIAHVIMWISQYLLYRGALRLGRLQQTTA